MIIKAYDEFFSSKDKTSKFSLKTADLKLALYTILNEG